MAILQLTKCQAWVWAIYWHANSNKPQHRKIGEDTVFLERGTALSQSRRKEAIAQGFFASCPALYFVPDCGPSAHATLQTRECRERTLAAMSNSSSVAMLFSCAVLGGECHD